MFLYLRAVGLVLIIRRSICLYNIEQLITSVEVVLNYNTASLKENYMLVFRMSPSSRPALTILYEATAGLTTSSDAPPRKLFHLLCIKAVGGADCL
jgi:hypothetical protein